MNIEKIKNYNQKMLAVISTLGVILLVIFIIMMLPEVTRIFYRGHYDDTPSGLLAGDKIEQLKQENMRKQIVSYETPWLIDTLKSVYVIPVSITTLRRPEEIPVADEGLMSLMDPFPDFSKGKRGYYESKAFDGSYTNLILYYPLENKTLSLFNERILIGGVQAYYFKDDILLVFYSADKDTDKNGVIDLNDVKNLCIYSLQTERLQKVSDGESSVNQYQFIENTKDLLIKFWLYPYKDKQFITQQTPSKIMKYEYASQKLSDVIPQKIQADMQQLIEGN
ncbi:hypothetical protein FACS189451_09560 [Bacteroidia bacterium]|nr:hypothetical protein FACS189446_4260 [Bacteroidia bacterium]GHT63240.1 hypothetical protein FACS189451_09560 [Bacteroidia bacterium]